VDDSDYLFSTPGMLQHHMSCYTGFDSPPVTAEGRNSPCCTEIRCYIPFC